MKLGMFNYGKGRVILGLATALSGCGTGSAQLKAADAVTHTASRVASAAEVAAHMEINKQGVIRHEGLNYFTDMKDYETTNPPAFWQLLDDLAALKTDRGVCQEGMLNACTENPVPNCFERFQQACRRGTRFFVKGAMDYYNLAVSSFKRPVGEDPRFYFASRIPGNEMVREATTKSPEASAQLRLDMRKFREANEDGDNVCKVIARVECDAPGSTTIDDCTPFIDACQRRTDFTTQTIKAHEEKMRKLLDRPESSK